MKVENRRGDSKRNLYFFKFNFPFHHTYLVPTTTFMDDLCPFPFRWKAQMLMSVGGSKGFCLGFLLWVPPTTSRPFFRSTRIWFYLLNQTKGSWSFFFWFCAYFGFSYLCSAFNSFCADVQYESMVGGIRFRGWLWHQFYRDCVSWNHVFFKYFPFII